MEIRNSKKWMLPLALVMGMIVTGQSAMAQTVTFTCPDGGDFYGGLFGGPANGAYHIRHKLGVRFQVRVPEKKNASSVSKEGAQLEVRCTLLPFRPQKGRRDRIDSTMAIVRIPVTKDWQEVTIPVSAFDYRTGREGFLDEVKHIAISVQTLDGRAAGAEVRELSIPAAASVEVATSIYSKPLDEKGKTEYSVTVRNSSSRSQSYTVNLEKHGWEGMDAEVSPASLQLAAGQEATVTVCVSEQEPGYIPPGSHEVQELVVAPLLGEGEAGRIRLITIKPVTEPFTVLSEAGWAEVKAKTQQYDWAKRELEEYIREAERFGVPEIKASTDPRRRGNGIIRAYIEGPLFRTAVAYKLTGNRSYGEKVAELLRRCAHPQTGYPYTRHLTFQDMPQEGGTFEGLLWGYDLIRNDGFLTPEEHAQVLQMFRIFCEGMVIGRMNGGISNWSVFNQGPAAQCALMIHDLDLFNKIVYGNNGLIDQFRYGVLDDGWWYEMSLSYNLGTAACLTQVGISAKAFGIDLLHTEFPSSLTRKVGLRPFEFDAFQGMAFGKFGPLTHPGVGIKRMWDGIVAYPDYRGVMFGMGDGHEMIVSGGQFELAYYAFRDPAYAAIIRRGEKRDLVYGVPELPADAPDYSSISTCSPNAGLAVLRSQTTGRTQGEQLQVAMKYGTHGSYHGHFDRLSLVSLMRYGRSFYNPETSWYGYASYMYKWWVQPSMSHNMVVVDGLQQEPTFGSQLLFHTGPMLQAVAVETDARWSNPPYLGGYDQIEDIRKGDRAYVFIPEDHPEPTDIGAYTEPIHERRLMAVTDDYVLIADYLRSDKADHQFDNLLQLRGAQPAAGLTPSGHLSQWDNSPLSSGQFITNVQGYTYPNGARINSVHHFRGKDYTGVNWETGGLNGGSDIPGDLHMDVHALWPRRGEVHIGTYAEAWGVGKKMEYTVFTDKDTLMTGAIGTWILGKADLKADLRGCKTLSFRLRADGKLRTLMLGDVILTDASGKEIPLNTLTPLLENVLSLPREDADYEGGPIVIAGTPIQKAVGIEPDDRKDPALLTYSLEGLNIVSMRGTLGGDFPVGPDNQVRKTVGVRQKGREASFLTLIEPYEKTSLIKDVKTLSSSEVEITLTDGRLQRIRIEGFFTATGTQPRISIEEYRAGKLLRKEEAK